MSQAHEKNHYRELGRLPKPSRVEFESRSLTSWTDMRGLIEEMRGDEVVALENESDEGLRSVRRWMLQIYDAYLAHLETRPKSIPEFWIVGSHAEGGRGREPFEGVPALRDARKCSHLSQTELKEPKP